jgi:hypothetical protein
MILCSDYIDRLIAEYEAANPRTPLKWQKSPLKRNKIQTQKPSPRTSGPGDAFCKWCNRPFRRSRADQEYDSVRCRKAAFRERKGAAIYARLRV